MVKKIIKPNLVLTVIAIMAILLVFNYKTFSETTNRLLEVFNIDKLRTFFDNYVTSNSDIYQSTVDDVVNQTEDILSNLSQTRPLQEILLDILENTIIFLINFINYFLNIGVNVLIFIWIFINENINGTNLKIKYSKSALLFLKINELINLITRIIKNFLKMILNQVSIHRRKIALVFLLFIISNGLFYKILVEILIFIVAYIYHAFNLETYVVISSLGKAIVIFAYPKLKSIPYFILIPLLIILVFLKAISKAEKKLSLNHIRLKVFAKDTLTQTTFINGPPGSGKTLLNVSLSLASEENFIDILEEKLLEYELKYPYLNFAKIRDDPTKYPEHKEYAFYLEMLNNRKSYIISNYAIYSPYFKEYSKIFDFNFMRKNIMTDTYALEEYIVISLSELDKEYNAHDNMKDVGIDGAATFFSTVSHDLKRQLKLIADYQLKDQVPLRIRGNSEYFFQVDKRQKKYPFILGLYYLPFRILSNLVRYYIKRYETKKPYINKKTKRSTVAEYKRNDYTLLYAFLRKLAFTLNKISDFFDHYWYFKIKGELSEKDGAKGTSHSICINICDLSIENMALYDSTFLSYAYEQKKNKAFKDLEKFTSLKPSIEELTKCHSRFYDKLNGITSQ